MKVLWLKRKMIALILIIALTLPVSAFAAEPDGSEVPENSAARLSLTDSVSDQFLTENFFSEEAATHKVLSEDSASNNAFSEKVAAGIIPSENSAANNALSKEAATDNTSSEASVANNALSNEDSTDITVSEDASFSSGSGILRGSSEETGSGDASEVTDEPEIIGDITLNASGDDGILSVVWKSVDSAEYYMVYLDDNRQGVKIDMSSANAKCRYVFRNADGSIIHKVTVEAYKMEIPAIEPDPQTETDPEAQPDAQTDPVSQQESEPGSQPEPQPEPEPEPQPEPVPVLIAKGSIDNISLICRTKLKNASITAARLKLNLKTRLGETYNGYSVVQGGCTDGKYAYYLMVSPITGKGRILKTKIGSKTVMARSDVINDMQHGNGMTMDTTRNRLIISGSGSWRNKITAVDSGSLKTIKCYTVSYSKNGPWASTKSKGLRSIAYVKKYDCFIALQRQTYDLLVLDAKVNEKTGKCKVKGIIGTQITSKYPGTYQAMDADDRYVYLLLSYYSRKQPYNRILVLDWNSENLGVNTYWKCNNDGSGKPDAALKLKTPYEAENIYHIDRGDGTADFYLSEYYNHPKTKYVYKKKKVKVKWKKVKKKVKVKWKKVNGKWKYKMKLKKVWKYKKKWKKVKVKSGTYLNREGYVYYLGRF